jgi:hypothetical protein
MLTIHSNTDATVGHILARLKAIQPGGPVYDKAMHEAADTQLRSTVQRIHANGTASDGSVIGQYSATPIYVNPKNSPSSFQPVGKTGKTTFAKTGQPHLTRYFDQGYKDYRQQIGLAADRVVLTLRGDLRDGLAVIQTPNGYGLGWSDEGLYELSQKLEQRYGKKIWSPTAEERAAIVKGISEKLKINNVYRAGISV